MALRELLEALEEEGAAEQQRAEEERRREAARLLAEARGHAANTRAAVLAAADAEAQQEAQELLVAARFTARRAVRTARDDALAEVLRQARERLLALPGTAVGAAATSGCVDEVLHALPDATTVRVHPADAGSLPSPPLPVELITDLGTGGAIAENDDGRFVDNTFLTRLANSWPELRVGVGQSWELHS